MHKVTILPMSAPLPPVTAYMRYVEEYKNTS